MMSLQSIVRFFVILLLIAVTTVPRLAGQAPSSPLTERLRERIESSPDRPDEWILARRALPAFYEARAYAPVWVSAEGIGPGLEQLTGFIARVSAQGLEPGDYHLDRLMALVSRYPTLASAEGADLLVELELRATDAFLMLASHLVAGRTDPESLRSEWVAVRREANPIRRLQEAIDSGDVGGTLTRLSPAYAGYERLRDAREFYERIAGTGGWPSVPEGGKLERGMVDDRVTLLRRRLVVTNDLEERYAAGTAFDDNVESAVIGFQRRHGLDPDGVVGPATFAALNVSARDRVRMIEVNLERWRWLPPDLGARYIVVNIANFQMELVEDRRTTMTMRAIVGRPYRRTPVFSDMMTYLVLNPRWNVPTSIATQDILPKLRADPNYLSSQNMKAFEGWGADQKELKQSDVDWNQVTARNFIYHLRQEPGPSNALGRVKFMFPNPFNVYMHDTPSRELFGRTERTFSSGCIRLEKPLDLAAHLLGWNRQQLEAALARGGEQTIQLTSPLPVHVLYWTAWTDEDGSVQFRNDIYGRDVPVRQALDEGPPSSQ